MTAIRRKKVNVPTLIGRGITMLILIGLSILVLIPLVWTVCMALKPAGEIYNGRFFPTTLVWGNFVEAVTSIDFFQYLLNTLKVVIPNVVGQVISCSLVAYGFSRYNFKGKRVWFLILLATMMIPGELFTITNYGTITTFGWKNTYTVLIVPFLVSVFYIYLLRQSFLQIPNELYLAAKVDGTKDIKYLWKVMVPLSLPTLISITILKMMGAWNSYIWPRLVANDDAHRLITNGLRSAFTDTTGDVNYPVQMAAVALVSAPLFLVFVFLRKYIMSGVSRSGIKG